MLASLLLIYGASWLVAGVCALLVETARLLRLRPLPAALDVLGAAAMTWLSAPVMAPVLLIGGVRALARRRSPEG